MIPLPTIDALDAVTIPVSCPVSWDAMHGNERTRFCDSCRQNVHDVSELTRHEALELLSTDGKMPCLRIYRRQDGRVMTADCTTKRDRVWKWLHRRSAWAAWLFGLVFFMGCDKPNCAAGIPKWDVHSPVPREALQTVVGGAGVVAAPERKPIPLVTD